MTMGNSVMPLCSLARVYTDILVQAIPHCGIDYFLREITIISLLPIILNILEKKNVDNFVYESLRLNLLSVYIFSQAMDCMYITCTYVVGVLVDGRW